MTTRTFFKFLFFYLSVFCSLTLVFFLFLWFHRKRNFSEERLERLIVGVARWREKTSDPCKYAIFGDPISSGEDYVKINFNCDGRKSANSFSLKTIKKARTYENVIKEIARINGFDDRVILGSTNHWVCYSGKKRIEDFSREVKKKEIINCWPVKDRQQDYAQD